MNFFNINFLAHPKRPILAPQKKKVYVPHFLGKNAKKGTHINFFGGIFGVKNGDPNGPFSATKSLVYCSFLPLLKSEVWKRGWWEGLATNSIPKKTAKQRIPRIVTPFSKKGCRKKA